MPELDTTLLEQIAYAIFRDGKPISDLADGYTIDELVRAYQNIRRGMSRLLNGLTTEQINFNPDPGTYSLSEVVSHLIAAQGNTYNSFIDIASSTRPHIDPVPRSPGGGAEKGLTAPILQGRLQKAADDLLLIIQETYRPESDKRVFVPQIGEVTQKGVLLFDLVHSLDHLKQAQALRRSPLFPARHEPQPETQPDRQP